MITRLSLMSPGFSFRTCLQLKSRVIVLCRPHDFPLRLVRVEKLQACVGDGLRLFDDLGEQVDSPLIIMFREQSQTEGGHRFEGSLGHTSKSDV